MPTEVISNRYMVKQGIPPQQVTWNDELLTFDEISKFFTLPAAEASSILGVCTTTLKRICNENGIPRWPYRKVMAGKSIEEIKREAVLESSAAQHVGVIHSSGLSTSQSTGDTGLDTSRARSLPANMVRTNAVQLSQQSCNASGHLSSSAIANFQGVQRQKPVPSNFLDVFKQGFPQNSLPVSTNRWWGNTQQDMKVDLTNSSKDNKVDLQEPATQIRSVMNGNQAGEVKTGCPQNKDTEETISSTERSERAVTMNQAFTADSDEQNSMAAVSMLVKLRKKAAASGRRRLNLEVSRGFNCFKLRDNDANILRFIFGNNLPSQWEASLSSS